MRWPGWRLARGRPSVAQLVIEVSLWRTCWPCPYRPRSIEGLKDGSARRAPEDGPEARPQGDPPARTYAAVARRLDPEENESADVRAGPRGAAADWRAELTAQIVELAFS